ncbi:uncharacterized protein LOC135476557 [Liolophura sinensis]|uniref:uncharacterized protein LOC135476557 n=1 Tax=Liolophura sinensis TaxID=3198878 RepID=UPI003159260F
MASARNTKVKPSKTPVPQAKQQGGIAFEISLDDNLERPPSAGPGRLRRQPVREPVTVEEMQEKQRKAEERRKEAEAEKLHKIHIREENCRKVTQKMDKIVNRLPIENCSAAKPFDENEVVPALKHKTGVSESAKQKTPKVESATKNSGSKSDLKNVKKSSKMP